MVALPATAKMTATVDRNVVSELDLITFTLRVENTSTTESPNFSAIARDFDIVQQSGPNRSSKISIINGVQQSESFTEWHLTLRPRRQGEFQIPAFRLGGEVSQPITVRVTEASAAAQNQMNQFVFFETSVSKSSVYVQEELIYTVRLYYVDAISGDFPAPPRLENAVIETIENERRFESIVDNRRFFVLEKKYAIYPQRSGSLEIPREAFSGTRGRGNFFSSRERVGAVSEGHRLRVKPRPAAFSGTHWLPASNVSMSETWKGNLDELVVGEPINREITLNVSGVAASLLPPMTTADIDGAKTYQDPPNTESTPTDEGMRAVLTTTIGVVPTREGSIEIPEVRIPWWNTSSDRQEVAVIPARRLEVNAGVMPSVSVPPASSVATSPGVPAVPASATATNLWPYLTLLLGVLWLITLRQWHVARRQSTKAEVPEQPLDHSDEHRAYQQLESACHNSDPSAASTALYRWARFRFPQISSLQELCTIAADPELDEAIRSLELCLYAGDPDTSRNWQGGNLLAATSRLRNESSDPETGRMLPPQLNPL